VTARKLPSLVLVAIPLLIWCVHILYLVPRLENLSGDAQFLKAMYFFAACAVIMMACELLAIVRWSQSRDRISLLAILLNWTWLYYVKVLYLGPTIGDL
jgi:hypothetical protein